MALELLNEDSILKSILNLSGQLTDKYNICNKSEYALKKKEIFKLSYEILLNKHHSSITDKRSDYKLDQSVTELIFFILCRNKGYITKDIRKKIIAKADRLSELARQNSESLIIVKSMLRMLLLLNDNLPKREVKGIMMYKEAVWSIEPYQRNRSWNLYKTNDLNFQSLMCIKENFDSPFFSFGKIKKSATWHDGVMNVLSSSLGPSTAVARPSSQTLISQDEGFVTPDDHHREETPEPAKNLKRESGCWFTWDIVSTPPSQYKTWESQWIMPTVKESDNLINILETSHNAKRIDNILKGLPVPPPLENFISIDRLADDIVSLLCGLPSSTFQLSQENNFKLAYGTYTTGITPDCLAVVVAPYIKYGETYRNIESFIEKKKCYDQIIPQAFLRSLSDYLYELKSTLLTDVDKLSKRDLWNRLKLFSIKPLYHLEYLWNLINVEDNMSCHQILGRMFTTLTYICDDTLLNVANVILLKCCYIYISLFEKYIDTGICAEELMCSGTGSLSVDKVPDFLRSLVEVINNSSKTLHLLHKDPKLFLLKSKLKTKKPEKVLKEPVDHRETLKEHYVKFMKEKEKERAKLAKKKSERLELIKDDIAAKKKWKELEAVEQEMKERKILDGYEKLDALKQKYIDDRKKEVEAEYEMLMRESDKKIAIANWKLKRLVNEKARSDLIKSDRLEERDIRESYLKNGIDLSKENRNIGVDPVEVRHIEIKISEIDVDETNDKAVGRHREASQFKKKMMEGDDIWKCNDDAGVRRETAPQPIDISEGMKMYEENRNKASEIKKKIMSSELELDRLPDVITCDFDALSRTEREDMIKDLTRFLPDDSPEINSYLKSSSDFFIKKREVKSTINCSHKYKFHSGTMNFIEMKHVFLKSAKDYLNKRVEVACRVVLEHIEDDFINEVRWILEHYLLLDGVWVSSMSKKLLTLIRHGTPNILALNRLFPAPLTVRSCGSPPAVFDPCDPSTIDFLILTYRPQEPLHHFITERFLLKYNVNFLYLVKFELAGEMIKDSLVFLRKRTSDCGLQYNQIHYHIFVMNHFILSLKAFINNAFEKCWEEFIKDADKVTSVDDLHYCHIRFIRKAQYFCLQSKRSSKIRDVLLTLLSHIYKYCETLRCGIISRGSDGHLIHSMHSSLNVYFRQYLVLSRKLYSIMVRITESGIADAFSDLREMLSINDFYSSL